jgi:osmotically-inducible protein OsmY
MKALVRSGIVVGTLALCLAILSSIFTIRAIAQEASPLPHMTHVAARKVNHQLEMKVREALDSAKLDTSNVRVVARGSKVSLEGTMPDATQIPVAGTTAAVVPGVLSVSNMLSVQDEGH